MGPDQAGRLQAQYARRASPIGLTVEELDFEHFPSKNGFPGIPVKAWIRFPDCAELVNGEVYAWTAKAVEVTWCDGPLTYRTWVWSSAVTRREEMVISLAGAGMLPDWKPQPTTQYSNLYYYDLLVHGQGVVNLITNKGVVWDGNNPIYRDEFEQHYYRGPDDDKLNGAINSVEEGSILMNNHSLIASNSEDNKKALENMRKLVRQ
jgi:hypothetical protein